MSRLVRRPEVADDIFELAGYLMEHSEDAAERFVDAVEKSLKDLTARPGSGSRKDFEAQGLSEVRSWWVEGFPNFLIYYLPLQDGIDVLGVLHGARDVESKLRRRI
jgi:toxin ParE1/3/4